MKTETIAGFLDSIHFDKFSTFTFRKPTSLAATRRTAEKLANFLGENSDIFWAAEPHELGSYEKSKLYYPDSSIKQPRQVLRYHFHALINSHISSMDIWGFYYPRWGRCHIIDNSNEKAKAASYYLSKYCAKKVSDYDYHFSDRIKNRMFNLKNFEL